MDFLLCELAESMLFQIVDRDSGILNLRNETNNAMVADHHTICKFENHDDPRYKDVRNVLIYMAAPFIDESS
jgi:hypothetical protein